MTTTTNTGDARKANLLQISEEDLAREGSPASARITIETNESTTIPEPKKRKLELNFHELWGYSRWRQFTSITPGNDNDQFYQKVNDHFHYNERICE